MNEGCVGAGASGARREDPRMLRELVSCFSPGTAGGYRMLMLLVVTWLLMVVCSHVPLIVCSCAADYGLTCCRMNSAGPSGALAHFLINHDHDTSWSNQPLPWNWLFLNQVLT